MTNTKLTVPNTKQVDTVRRRAIVVSTAAVWITPVVQSVVLPVHAQTTGPVVPADPFTVRIAAADAATGVLGEVTGATPKEAVTVSMNIDPVDFDVTGNADTEGTFPFALSTSEIEAEGASLRVGATVKATATSATGKADVTGDTAVITGPAKLITKITSADSITGVSGTVAGAVPREAVTIDLLIDAVPVSVVSKADATGQLTFNESVASLTAKGATLKGGSSVKATSTSASGRVDTVGDTAIATGPAKLTTRITRADSLIGVSGAVTGAAPRETVTIDLLIDRVELSVLSKADATGRATFSESAESLSARGVTLKSGSSVKATSTSASGRADTVGDTAIATGPTKLDLTLDTADAIKGVIVQIRNLAAGETASVALIQEANTVTKIVKTDVSAVATFTASPTELKLARINSKAGAAFRITAVAVSSELKGELSSTFRAV